MASSYRDAVLRLIPPVTKRQAQTRLRRNNTTGVPGIFARRVKGQIVGWIATLDAVQYSDDKRQSQASLTAIAAGALYG